VAAAVETATGFTTTGEGAAAAVETAMGFTTTGKDKDKDDSSSIDTITLDADNGSWKNVEGFLVVGLGRLMELNLPES